MRITPLDVRKQEFRKVVRGLDADEVYAFLTTVADEYEACLSDNKQLREKVIDLDEKVSEYRNMETTLRDTLLTAERVMSEARQNARKEAELILRDATIKASGQTAHIAAEVEALKNQLRELRGQRDGFLARLQSLAESQVRQVESFRRDFQNEDDERSAHRVASFRSSSAVPDDDVPAPAESAFDDQNQTEVTAAAESADRAEVDTITEALFSPDESSSPEEVSKPTTAAEDHWRDYQVGARPTAAPRGEETLRDMPSQAPTATLEEESVPTSVYETEPASAYQTGYQTNYQAETDAVEVAVSDTTPPPPVDTQVDALEEHVDPSEEDPVDRIARMMVEASALEEAASSGGHEDFAVATSPASADGEAATEDVSDQGSRWSLSRFTKGLANF